MPGRIFQGQYRFGFNGKEQDNEVKGEGNTLDFGARIYDSRLGRWLSADPFENKYPGISTYNYTLNNPILFKDPNGKGARQSIDYETHTIVLETTVYLYGPKASEEMTKSYNDQYAKINNCRDITVNGEPWTVQINVNFVYSKTLSDTYAAMLKDDPTTKQLTSEGGLPKLENLQSAGKVDANFQSGDNILLVDPGPRLQKLFGAGNEGVAVKGSDEAAIPGFRIDVQINKAELTKSNAYSFQDIVEESFHMMGYDERYYAESSTMRHPGYDNDVTAGPLSNHTVIGEQKFIDLANKAVADSKVGSSDGKGKSMTTLISKSVGNDVHTIDETAHGNRPTR